ncbi:sugar phosphate isomerase/epimerase family protein [Polycladidibacter stylochi]|uniref:sugar phosphate isomerase/epimerase family protein n=1 Tax=Polycladidibacter stylochi TaxID=1807766 RepID=UPI000829FE5E|nr:sugar phosphate isomerase/epimerase family protein [Pseudovibrio stylochi]
MVGKPVLGAALDVKHLSIHRDWLFERERPIEISDFCSPNTINGDWQGLADECRRILEGFQGPVGLHGPFYGIDLAAVEADSQQLTRKKLQIALDACAAFGATQMVLHSPYSYWCHQNLDSWPGARDRMTDVTCENLRLAVERASSMGVELVLENIEDIDPRWRVDVVQQLNSAAIGVSIDTGHAQLAHSSYGSVPVDYFVQQAGGYLRHVHLQDIDGYADRHWHAGEGIVPWKAVFRAIELSGAQPRLLLEVTDMAHVQYGAAYLQSLGIAE